MTRIYRLACNFNVVEITPEYKDLLDMADETEIGLDENDEEFIMVGEDELLRRLLQREYDILAAIEQKNTVNAVTPRKAPAASGYGKPASRPRNNPAFEKPSPAQIEWAENLGMENAASKSKKEVWEYIQKNK
jgi:hypothetical protein